MAGGFQLPPGVMPGLGGKIQDMERFLEGDTRLGNKGRRKKSADQGKKQDGGKQKQGGGKKDKGFFGHYDAVGPKTVANPSTKVAHKADAWTAKPFKGMNRGPVGKAAPIAGKGQGKV